MKITLHFNGGPNDGRFTFDDSADPGQFVGIDALRWGAYKNTNDGQYGKRWICIAEAGIAKAKEGTGGTIYSYRVIECRESMSGLEVTFEHEPGNLDGLQGYKME